MTVTPPPGGRMPTLGVERGLLGGGCRRLAAIDEVGRGALAGPVSVGVVVMTAGMRAAPAGLKDSKLLTPAARAALVAPIRAWAEESAVGHAEPAEIDEVGIMAALRLAAGRALAALSGPVDAVLLDGNYDYLSSPPTLDGPGTGAAGGAEGPVIPAAYQRMSTTPVHLLVKADRDCASVAAASVLAKVTRDALMVELAARYPAFGWAQNKGYGTSAHLAAIAAHGPCEQHRRSWSLPTCVDTAAAAASPATGSPARSYARSHAQPAAARARLSSHPAAVGDDDG